MRSRTRRRLVLAIAAICGFRTASDHSCRNIRISSRSTISFGTARAMPRGVTACSVPAAWARVRSARWRVRSAVAWRISSLEEKWE